MRIIELSALLRSHTLLRTLVGSALQQQPAFLQNAKLLHADEVVVHAGNLPLPRLSRGTCQGGERKENGEQRVMCGCQNGDEMN